jgi:hypothetical protein
MEEDLFLSYSIVPSLRKLFEPPNDVVGSIRRAAAKC